jgi:hypothetical protein
MNPLSSYSSSGASGYEWKGRGQNLSVVGSSIVGSNTTASIILTGYLREPLFTTYNNGSGSINDQHSGMWLISQENININFQSDLFNNMIAYFSPSTALTLNFGTVSFNSNANLKLRYLQATSKQFTELPKSMVYKIPYYILNRTSIGTVANKSLVPAFQFPAISLSVVPEKIFIFAKSNQLVSASCAIPDTYLKILSCNISFNNSQYFFSGADSSDLFEASKRNGLNVPRACFLQEQLNERAVVLSKSYGCGSVFVVDCVRDLGLSASDLTVGSAGKFVLSLNNLSFYNNTDTTMNNVDCNVIVQNSGVLQRTDSTYTAYTFTTTDAMVQESKKLAPVPQHDLMNLHRSDGFSGGNIYKRIIHKGKKLGDKYMAFYKKHKNAIDKVHSMLMSRGEEAPVGEGMRRHSRLYQ